MHHVIYVVNIGVVGFSKIINERVVRFVCYICACVPYKHHLYVYVHVVVSLCRMHVAL